MAESELIDYYRAKVINLQVEATELTNTPQNTGRRAALVKMANFYIEEIEKANRGYMSKEPA